MLAAYPLLLGLIRRLPAHEYEQAVRAPAWLAVIVGAGIALLSAITLGKSSAGSDQIFIGWSGAEPTFVIDAYTLWASLLIGVLLMALAWVPGARRSLVPRTIWPFVSILLLTWLALLLIFTVHLLTMLWLWLLLVAGVLGLWWYLLRPRLRWPDIEPGAVLLLALLFGILGLLLLNAAARGQSITTSWTTVLNASPRLTNGALLLLALGWLGPAAYLTWWLWGRRDDAVMVWMPAAMLLAVTGQLAFVRPLLLMFPASGTDFAHAIGVEQLFLVRRMLGWLLAWGVLALLTGAGWLAYLTIRRARPVATLLRPLSLVFTGLLLVAIAGGIIGQRDSGIVGLLWVQLAWTGITAIWLAANGLLPALVRGEKSERLVVQIALWFSLAVLAALPLTPVYRALTAIWRSLSQLGAPPLMIVIPLVIAAIAAGVLLVRWVRMQAADRPHPGTGWGILAPFLLAFALLACSLLGRNLTPLLEAIRASLQAF